MKVMSNWYDAYCKKMCVALDRQLHTAVITDEKETSGFLKPINYVEQNLRSKADSSSTNQILGLLWNSMVQYRLHNSPSLDAVLSQVDPVHTLIHYLFKIQLNVILLSKSVSSK
jgi:hypothetical protein